MFRTLAPAALIAATLSAAPASAQQFIPMEYDTNVQFAVNEMLNTLSWLCNNGDPVSCNSFGTVQQTANNMQWASNNCQMGDQNACQSYFQEYAFMDQMYGVFSQQVAMAQAQAAQTGGGFNPLGATHADRMDNIAAWGAARTQFAADSQAALDASHARAMAAINGN